MVAPTVEDVARFFPRVNLDAYANEILLLHRTHQSSATKIMQQGFDQRLAQRRLYGRGIYFTAESCKARQVGKRHHDTSCIMLTRVVLGHPFMAEGPMTKHERPTFQFELRKLPQKSGDDTRDIESTHQPSREIGTLLQKKDDDTTRPQIRHQSLGRMTWMGWPREGCQRSANGISFPA